jgi:hypothetical protein
MTESEVVEEEVYPVDEFEKEEVVNKTSSSKDEYNEDDFEKEEETKVDDNVKKEKEIIDEYRADDDFEKEEEIIVSTPPIVVEPPIVTPPVVESPRVIVIETIKVKTPPVIVVKNEEITKTRTPPDITNDKINPKVVKSKSNNDKQPATKLNVKPKPSREPSSVKVNKTKKPNLEDTLNKSINSNSSVTTTGTRSMVTSQRSKPRAPMTQAEKDAELESKLTQLTQDLDKIKVERKEFQKVSSTKYVNKHIPKFKPQKTVAHKVYGKYEFWHPHLELAMGELMYSPYLTNPMKTYPKSTFDMVHKLREIRATDKEFNELDDKPFDADILRKKYIKDIMHFNPSFNMTNKDKNKDKDGEENTSVAASSTPNLLESIDSFGGDSLNNTIPRPSSDSRKQRTTEPKKKRSDKNLPKLNKIPSTTSLMNGMFAEDSILIGPDDNIMSTSLNSSSFKKIPQV